MHSVMAVMAWVHGLYPVAHDPITKCVWKRKFLVLVGKKIVCEPPYIFRSSNTHVSPPLVITVCERPCAEQYNDKLFAGLDTQKILWLKLHLQQFSCSLLTLGAIICVFAPPPFNIFVGTNDLCMVSVI